jgi:hypothetical protein
MEWFLPGAAVIPCRGPLHARGCRSRLSGPAVCFGVYVRNDNREGTPPLVRLKAVCGPRDQGEPVVTVMLPEED